MIFLQVLQGWCLNSAGSVSAASQQELLSSSNSFSYSFQPAHPDPPLSLPTRTIWGAPSGLFFFFFLPIMTHGYIHLSDWLGGVLASHTTFQAASLTSSQLVGAIMAGPMGHLSCQLTLLLLTEAVGTIAVTPTDLPSQWQQSWLFSQLACQFMLLPIQLYLAFTHSLSCHPTICSLWQAWFSCGVLALVRQ